jgi:hypothetical protein
LYSVSGAALLDSGIAFPLTSQAVTVIAAPEDEREPDISVILMEFRAPTELENTVVDPHRASSHIEESQTPTRPKVETGNIKIAQNMVMIIIRFISTSQSTLVLDK